MRSFVLSSGRFALSLLPLDETKEGTLENEHHIPEFNDLLQSRRIDCEPLKAVLKT